MAETISCWDAKNSQDTYGSNVGREYDLGQVQ